jgi:hypothetical protein
LFTANEKDRLCEILFFGYFNNREASTLGDAKFWECVNAICKSYGIDSLFITRAIRTLMAKENRPEDFETWYLFSRIGTTVRPMKGFTGIYWQKQKKFEERFNAGEKPDVRRRITDVAVKRSMYSFVKAIYDIFGSYKFLDADKLDEMFNT